MDGDFTLNPGDIVAGKYQIIDALGVGGSGAVYRAQKVGMKLQVALKMMHAEHPDGDNERQRFAREAELVKRLQHPHIVRLMDYGHAEDGVPFLAFALLIGQPLEDKIKNEGPLDHATVGRFSQQVLRALDKAHSLDVVHRDLKPANIFLSSGVLGEMVQMLDFGLAKMVHDAPGAMDVTRAGSVLGTPRYMAPEQVRGEQVGPTADIYSFGLVMAEMLLGRQLIDGKKDIEIYVSQGSDREHVLPPEITESPFGAIVTRAVAKQLNVRYRQASQMLADVNAVMEALSGGQEVMSEADMEATFLMDPSQLQALSTPTATSGKLHAAFNAMADKQAQQKTKKQDAPQPAAPQPAAPPPAAAPPAAAQPQHTSTPPAAPYRASAPPRPAIPRATPPPRPRRSAAPRRATPPVAQPPAVQPPAVQAAAVVEPLAQTIPPHSSNGAIAAHAAVAYAARKTSSSPPPSMDTGPKIVVNAPLSSRRPNSAPPGAGPISGGVISGGVISGGVTSSGAAPHSGSSPVSDSAASNPQNSGIPGTGPVMIPGTNIPSTSAPPAIALDSTLTSAQTPMPPRMPSNPPQSQSLAPDEVTPTDFAPVAAQAKGRRRVGLIIAITVVVVVVAAAAAVWRLWWSG